MKFFLCALAMLLATFLTADPALAQCGSAVSSYSSGCGNGGGAYGAYSSGCGLSLGSYGLSAGCGNGGGAYYSPSSSCGSGDGAYYAPSYSTYGSCSSLLSSPSSYRVVSSKVISPKSKTTKKTVIPQRAKPDPAIEELRGDIKELRDAIAELSNLIVLNRPLIRRRIAEKAKKTPTIRHARMANIERQVAYR